MPRPKPVKLSTDSGVIDLQPKDKSRYTWGYNVGLRDAKSGDVEVCPFRDLPGMLMCRGWHAGVEETQRRADGAGSVAIVPLTTRKPDATVAKHTRRDEVIAEIEGRPIPAPEVLPVLFPQVKVCKTCAVSLPISEYYVSTRDGIMPHCRRCMANRKDQLAAEAAPRIPSPATCSEPEPKHDHEHETDT